MSNIIEISGNLGKKPELRTVRVGQEDRDVLEFSVYSSRRVPDGQGGYRDEGGFWLNGELWGRRAASSVEALDKGMLVTVKGSLVLETWKDRDTNEERQGFKLKAESILIDPITYSRK